MNFNRLAVTYLFIALTQTPAYGQESKPVTKPFPVLQERLRDARVTENRLSNGAVITEIRFAGSMQPNFDLDCISIADVKSTFNPPALLNAAKKCIKQGNHSSAWELLTTGLGFAYYDVKRLADRSTQGARTVLTMNAFGDLTTEERETSQKTSKEIQRNPEKVAAYCAELKRIGPPTYEPQWIILHGVGVYDEPREGHYLKNVDPKALWEEVLKNRCTPQKS